MSQKQNEAARHSNIKHVAILGGGTAGWMTAAALIKLLPSHINVTLIESEQIGTVGVGEATIPHLRYFNQRLGIDENTFMQATDATYKLGIEFANWGKQNDAYIHPFGDYGHSIQGIEFHHVWLDQYRRGLAKDLDEYSLPVVAALDGKFDMPHPDPNHVGSTFSYAYHINATAYAKFLRKFSESLGVRRKEGKIVDVICRSSTGEIDSLICGDGERVHADLFVDCSGFRALLIEQVMKAGYADWSHWLPCNRAVAVACETDSAPLPYTKAIAHEAGWQWRIPLTTRLGNGHVYCDAFTSQDNALDVLLSKLEGKQLSTPNHLAFCAGQRKKAWVKNCVAIGLSSGFLEPLESTSIYLIQANIMKLLELFPSTNDMHIHAEEFNRCFDTEMYRIRDFLILHYHATHREDTEFWRYCKHMSIPDTLAQRFELFKETGHILPYQHGLFLSPSWVAVLMGQRHYPKQSMAQVTQLQPSNAKSALDLIYREVKNYAANMQTHESALKNKNFAHIAKHQILHAPSLYGSAKYSGDTAHKSEIA
ncbi:tryptophan halogenase family protein [Agaribacter flavus]|uniref:Tryptophan halogenase family protein n=1 Tax=Agaribacter flavus TaxID=1902781 RepID=A0ABV7FMP8_9ALTE